MESSATTPSAYRMSPAGSHSPCGLKSLCQPEPWHLPAPAGAVLGSAAAPPWVTHPSPHPPLLLPLSWTQSRLLLAPSASCRLLPGSAPLLLPYFRLSHSPRCRPELLQGSKAPRLLPPGPRPGHSPLHLETPHLSCAGPWRDQVGGTPHKVASAEKRALRWVRWGSGYTWVGLNEAATVSAWFPAASGHLGLSQP